MSEHELSEADKRRIIDIWDGPIVRPVQDTPQGEVSSTDNFQPSEDKSPEDQAHNPKSVGSATLGASRGWTGGWFD